MGIESAIPLPAPSWDEMWLPAPDDLTVFPLNTGFSFTDDIGLRRINTLTQNDNTSPSFNFPGGITTGGTVARLQRRADTGVPLFRLDSGTTNLVGWRHPWVLHADRDGGPVTELPPHDRVFIVDCVYQSSDVCEDRDGLGIVLCPGPLQNVWPTLPSSPGGMVMRRSSSTTDIVVLWYDTGGALLRTTTVPTAAFPDYAWLRFTYEAGRPGLNARWTVEDLRRSTVLDRLECGVDLPRYLSRAGGAGGYSAWGACISQINTSSADQYWSLRMRWGRFLPSGAPVGSP